MSGFTIIVPVRDEAHCIRACLDSITNQTYDEPLEVLVVDGLSTDATREIVKEYSSKFPRIRLLDNPYMIVPTAMNIGVREAKGDCIIRIDGHCFVEKDYIERCIEYLDKKQDVDCVGGTLINICTSVIGKAISLAMSSPFGVGDAYFRYSQQEAYVDTVAFGAYRRRVFDDIGLFDEELVRNQDDEFNYRLRESGGKILLVPEIKAYYYTRSSFRKLWFQYYQYGYWKVRVMQKHPKQMRLRQFVPPLFVAALLASLLAIPCTPISLWTLMIVGGSYAIANISASIFIGLRKELKSLPLLPVAFATLHLSYGIGFLAGLVKFANRWRDDTTTSSHFKSPIQRLEQL